MKIILVCILFAVGESTSLHSDPHLAPGRAGIVQLFEWTFKDIANECENVLGPGGYGAVQTSPVHENVVIDGPWYRKEVQRPWWERYQPVSYEIKSRSGNENDFRSMVQRCNKAGVRIIVDVVLNHMTGDYKGNALGTGGSDFDYEQMSYPGVPYNRSHFNSREKCGSGTGSISNWEDGKEVRNCMLLGMADLDQSQEYVRDKMADWLNKLIDIGVAGFRIDAAKHMWPEDLTAIYSRLHDLNADFFEVGSKAFIFHEVVYFGGGGATPQQYVPLGRVTDLQYAESLNRAFRNYGGRVGNLRHEIHNRGFLKSEDAIGMNENHDIIRGHVGDLQMVISYRKRRLHIMVTGFVLGYNYGIPKFTSNYDWREDRQGGSDRNDWVGPPMDEDQNIKPVACGDVWICEHRWPQIRAMVRFAGIAGDAKVTNWWSDGQNRIAWGREGRGFVVINNDESNMDVELETGMAPGIYCDVISGGKQNGACKGQTVELGMDGRAQFIVSGNNDDETDGILAIHVDSKL